MRKAADVLYCIGFITFGIGVSILESTAAVLFVSGIIVGGGFGIEKLKDWKDHKKEVSEFDARVARRRRLSRRIDFHVGG